MTETELPLRLRDEWYIACRSDRLGRKPLARMILGQPIVLFRDAAGAAAAVADRCAHRQMRLSAGRVGDDGIECPYHGWTYGSDGRCVRVPSLAETPAIRIAAYRAIESDGYIWVYLGERDPENGPFRFPHLGQPGWTTFRFETRFEAGAFSCLENFLDVPHTAYVHAGWFRSRASRDVRATIRRDSSGAVVEFEEEVERRSVVARLLFPNRSKLTHTDRFVMPSISRVDYSFGPDRHFIITSQCTPVSEQETDVYTVITFRYGSISPLVRLYFQPLSRRILRQDIDLLRDLSRSQQRSGATALRFVESDLLGPEILRLWRARISGASVDPASREVMLRF